MTFYHIGENIFYCAKVLIRVLSRYESQLEEKLENAPLRKLTIRLLARDFYRVIVDEDAG